MKAIKPYVEPFSPFSSYDNGLAALKQIEGAGRTCYKSEDKAGNLEKTNGFIRKMIKSGHHSVIEHYNFSMRWICDRGISHELVRHRLASFSQESTRYANYSKDRFSNRTTVIIPPWIQIPVGEYVIDDFGRLKFPNQEPDGLDPKSAFWIKAQAESERNYFRSLNEFGDSPEQARSFLTNSLKTEVVMTANLREWRHVMWLRCSKKSHPQMREVSLMALKILYETFTVFFEDIYERFFDEISS